MQYMLKKSFTYSSTKLNFLYGFSYKLYVELQKLHCKFRVFEQIKIFSAFADSVLSIMASLVPFLKKEDLNAMPMGLAMTLSIWPSQTHNHIIKLLAGYVLPILLGKYIVEPN